jgi:hypothetical protein
MKVNGGFCASRFVVFAASIVAHSFQPAMKRDKPSKGVDG